MALAKQFQVDMGWSTTLKTINEIQQKKSKS